MTRIANTFFSTIIAVFMIALLSISAFALEPEELTNATVTNEYGRVIRVEYYQRTGRWQALAEGNETIYSGLAPNENGMWLCQTGVVDFSFKGFAEFQGETWYVENGKVNTEFTGSVESGDYVYTIVKGKVTSKGYTTAVKQKMAITIGGFVAFIALIFFLKKRNKKQQEKHDEYIRQLKRESEERNRQFEEFERQEKIRKAQEVYEEEVENPGLKYRRANILTGREKQFYPYLKEVADKHGWAVSLKPRLGDLVTGADNQFTGRGKIERSKVQQKHVDFALFDPQSQEVVIIVELDDTTHDRQDRVNRDVFVDNVLKGTGYKILHVYDATDLEKNILNELTRVEAEED